MKHLNIRVHGIVQGVFFRSHTEEMAQSLDIKGFVRNESDGTVYIEAEGDEKSLQQLLDWCHTGPSSARVDKVESEVGELQSFTDFQTRYS